MGYLELNLHSPKRDQFENSNIDTTFAAIMKFVRALNSYNGQGDRTGFLLMCCVFLSLHCP